MNKKIIYFVLFLLLIGMHFFSKNINYENTKIDRSMFSFARATVLEVLNEEIEDGGEYKDIPLGTQLLKVKVKSGILKGEELVVENNLSTTQHILTEKGSKIILSLDMPAGVKPYITVYNYDRMSGLILYLLLFIAIMVLIGKKQGFKAAIALFISIYIVYSLMIPLIYIGYSPIKVSILTGILICLYSILIIYDISKMSLINIMSISMGFIMTTVLIKIVSIAFKLNGYLLEDSESLMVVMNISGLKVSELLFSTIMISSLGAVMDVSVSISSALCEIKALNSNIEFKTLFNSGMNIGKDIIGTMSNTLIFAFIGNSLTTILILLYYGTSTIQLVNSNFF